MTSPPSGIRVGRILGIPVYIDPTLIIIVGALAVFNLRGGVDAFLRGLIFLGILFGSVLWHELGHAIAVRRLGLGKAHIVLHGLGGVTRYARNPTPRQGVVVAAAGPAIGLALAALLYPVELVSNLGPTAAWALSLAVTVNLLLNLLNLLPMMPLDGGQIVRFGLMTRLDTMRALRISALVGVTVLASTVAAVWLLDLGSIFVWLILAFIAAENVRLFQMSRRRD